MQKWERGMERNGKKNGEIQNYRERTQTRVVTSIEVILKLSVAEMQSLSISPNLSSVPKLTIIVLNFHLCGGKIETLLVYRIHAVSDNLTSIHPRKYVTASFSHLHHHFPIPSHNCYFY